jgi:hypothetical protein
MASPEKQAKRARRAKAKAKQARAIRNNPSRVLSEELLDDVALGLIGILSRLAEAESISMVDMLITLFRETNSPNAQSVDEEIDNQIIILKVYGRKIEGRSKDWMENAEFLQAYAKAATRIGREELIDAWHDAHDFEETVASELDRAETR